MASKIDAPSEPAKADAKPQDVQSQAKPEVKPEVKRKPGYSNPALKAMGISSIRLPSRNWTIFWTVIAVGVGGYAYDKYEQKQARKKWMERVKHYGEDSLPPNMTARKLTIYIAPPPSDYLDESLAVFRRYVKPVLNAGGVDYQVKSENRQGVIRSMVAAEIRSLRREVQENSLKLKEYEESQKWYNRVKSWFTRNPSVDVQKVEQKVEDGQYTLTNLLGVYYNNPLDEDSLKNEDAFVSDPSANGGVICIGRGAYKEYLHGLHEGLLGPLDKPLGNVDIDVPLEGVEIRETPETPETPEPPVVKSLDDVEGKSNEIEELDSAKTKDDSDHESNHESNDEFNYESRNDSKDEEETDEEGNKLQPIPKPFIAPSEYANAKFAPELQFNGKIPTESKVSPIFQQPILVIPVYHLIGFLQTPQRIWRFYNRRQLAEDYGRAACSVVENLRAHYKMDHVDWCKEEEHDWPSKWVKKGEERGSEWVQDLVVDERVLEKLWVYEPSKVDDQ
jgi:import inner membrane translocase subunit TIM54